MVVSLTGWKKLAIYHLSNTSTKYPGEMTHLLLQHREYPVLIMELGYSSAYWFEDAGDL